MWPFKRKPNPTNEALMLALKLSGQLGNRVAALEAQSERHAEAIDRLGELFEVEYDPASGEWQKRKIVELDEAVSDNRS